MLSSRLSFTDFVHLRLQLLYRLVRFRSVSTGGTAARGRGTPAPQRPPPDSPVPSPPSPHKRISVFCDCVLSSASAHGSDPPSQRLMSDHSTRPPVACLILFLNASQAPPWDSKLTNIAPTRRLLAWPRPLRASHADPTHLSSHSRPRVARSTMGMLSTLQPQSAHLIMQLWHQPDHAQWGGARAHTSSHQGRHGTSWQRLVSQRRRHIQRHSISSPCRRTRVPCATAGQAGRRLCQQERGPRCDHHMDHHMQRPHTPHQRIHTMLSPVVRSRTAREEGGEGARGPP